MRVQFEDQVYEFGDKLTVSEAMLLYDKAHIGISELSRELVRGNPYVVVTLVFILKRRAKEAVLWDSLLTSNALDIRLLPDASEESPDESDDESSAEAPADPPTSPSGRSRKRGTTST